MNRIVLDFDGVKSLWALHEYLKEMFHLPEYYGRNMDALWDCLHCSFECPTMIELKNIEKIPPELGRAVELMLELFDDLQREEEEVTVRIQNGGGGGGSPLSPGAERGEIGAGGLERGHEVHDG